MINIKKYLYDKLSGDTALTALVGNRIYPGVAPEGSPNPCITFHRIGGKPSQTGVNRVMYQLSIRGKNESVNEGVLAVLGRLVNRVKEPPIKYMYIERYGDDTYDIDTKSHGTHLSVIISYNDQTR